MCHEQLKFMSHVSSKPPSITSESESESDSKMCYEDLPMRQRPVKLSVLRLNFSSFSELEESSLEKLRSLRAAHARDIIF
jgi:hypothetical protein